MHVVIPVHNRKKYTETCLFQLSKQTYRDLDITVVDDGSVDGTEEMIKSQFSNVRLIKGDGTHYWTGAIRIGVDTVLKECGNDDYILVLNDDLIFGPEFVETLAAAAQKHPKALVHALNSYTDQKDIIEFGGVKINWWTAKKQYLNKDRLRAQFPKGHCQRSDVLWGRGLAVPVRVFRDIGNYDLRIVHRGDQEFPRRAAKAGYDLLVVYDAVAYMYRTNDSNINERQTYALTDFKDYFFGVLSSGRIKVLFWNSMLMTNNRFQGWIYFLFYTAGHAFHFFRRVRCFSRQTVKSVLE